jgi:hypothetical protein
VALVVMVLVLLVKPKSYFEARASLQSYFKAFLGKINYELIHRVTKMLKYLRYSLNFIPYIPLILFLYLSFTVPEFKYVELALMGAGVVYIAYAYFNTRKLFKNFETGHNLPKVLVDFPVYETSESEYRLIRQKVEQFVLAVEASTHIEVSLTADDLNCLRTKGESPNKIGSNSIMSLPSFYEIQDGRIYKHSLKIAPFVSSSGFQRFVFEINFEKEDGKFIEIHRMIKKNEKEIEIEKQLSIKNEFVCHQLLDIILYLDKTLAWKDSMKLVIGKLQEVEVQENKLVLRA